jgi:ClpP class serine protease
MNKEELKKELHSLIDNMEDEELLNMVKEDIVAYQTENKKDFDDLSGLTPEERKELEELATEDPDKDTISYEEFKQHIQGWRTRLSTKRDF